jgi:hypothetical protein
MNRMLWTALLILAAPLARADLVEISPDLYLLTKSGTLVSHVKIKLDAIREASDFARSKGLVALPVSGREYLPVGAFSPAIYEYQFRLVSAEQAQRERATLADVVVSTSGKADTSDLYIQLVKLDMLRQRGLLTPAEFERQKQRALGSEDEEDAARPTATSDPPATN